MVRQNENVAARSDVALDALWDRASRRQLQTIEDGFFRCYGGDLIAEAESARSAGTAEMFADLGRWVARSWVEYRDEQLDRLESEGMLP